MNSASLATLAVHAGQSRAKPDFTPIATPIYNAVTYGYSSAQELDAVFAGERDGFVYHRYGNPTTSALEDAVAQIEGTEGAVACASGMAAIHLALLAAGARAGATVLAAQDLYGHSFALLSKVLSAQGVRVHFVDMADLSAVAAAAAQLRPAILYAETLSNPLLKVANIPALAQHAHDAGAVLVVDNTFATPINQNPLQLGADLVLHSATKFLGGHADALGGVVCGSKSLVEQVYHFREINGATLHPMAAYLLLRGMKTLHLRIRQQNESALMIARFLETHPSIERVFYPGLESHENHAVACRQMRGFGGVLSFILKGNDFDSVRKFLPRLRYAHSAANLGSVETIVGPPATTSHVECTRAEREAMGIPESLIRYSVGVEDSEDLIADLEQALG